MRRTTTCRAECSGEPTTGRSAWCFRTTGCSRTCRCARTSRSGCARTALPARPHSRRADDWLGRFGLTDFAARKPGALSGGQAQRVALARALAFSTATCSCLDEPLAALDAQTRLEVRAELRRHLADFAGPTLFITHDPLDAMVLTDRLLVIEDGRIVQQGPPAEVARRPLTQYVARLVGPEPLPRDARRRRPHSNRVDRRRHVLRGVAGSGRRRTGAGRRASERDRAARVGPGRRQSAQRLDRAG